MSREDAVRFLREMMATRDTPPPEPLAVDDDVEDDDLDEERGLSPVLAAFMDELKRAAGPHYPILTYDPVFDRRRRQPLPPRRDSFRSQRNGRARRPTRRPTRARARSPGSRSRGLTMILKL